MSDTPETDAQIDAASNIQIEHDRAIHDGKLPFDAPCSPWVVPADFARRLERERDELRRDLDKALAEIDHLENKLATTRMHAPYLRAAEEAERPPEQSIT